MQIYNRNPYIVDAVQIPDIESSIEEFTAFIQDLQKMFERVVFDWRISDENYVSIHCYNASGIDTSIGPGGWIVKSGTYGEKLTAMNNVKFTKEYTLKTEENLK